MMYGHVQVRSGRARTVCTVRGQIPSGVGGTDNAFLLPSLPLV